MNKKTNHRFQETYYETTLENGLKVVLWEKKNFTKSFFIIGTPYGALDYIQIDENNKVYTFPRGIAHFLEHKMFEKQDRDIMEEFISLGANCNAFTSYHETAYYFSTSEEPYEPLKLLLDFVQTLDVSEQSVEKEKGIILQELEMYIQMSEQRILNATMESLYENHPLRYDIAGDKESVSSTTKELLETCYQYNYHPSTMILVGVTGRDITKVLDVIIEHQRSKQFPKIPKLKRAFFEENNRVYKKCSIVEMEVSIPRICIAYKLEGVNDPKERNFIEWCYKIFCDIFFTSLNENYQVWLNEEIINHSFTYEIDLGEDYGMLMFYTETNKEEQFIFLIQTVLNSIQDIDTRVLEQLKRRYFGMSISALESMKQIAITYMRCYFAKQDFYECIEDIEKVTMKDVLNAYQRIDLDNYTITKIVPK